MKRQIYLMTVMFITSLLFFINLNAQYCGNSGSTICTPGGPYPKLGFYPPYDSTPCVQIGVPFTHKLDLQVPATVFYAALNTMVNLNYVKVNYISNLPCGLCWSSDVPNNTFNGNSTHCIHIVGTSYDAPGQYKALINIDAQASVVGFPVTLTNQNADSFGVKFWARVENLDGTCVTVDTLIGGNTAHTSGTITTPTITGSSTVCSGATTSLSINAASFYAYKWSTGETTSSITAGAGTYTVTVYAACTSATATKTIGTTTITATATPNGPTTFCQGGNVTLNAGSGFSAYAWSGGGGTSQTAAYTTAGVYHCTVTQNGCTGTTNDVTVTVNSAPAPTVTANGPTTFCSGGSVTLDAGSGYSAYSWSDNSTNQTLTATAAGSYTCTVTQNGCTGASNTINVTVGNPTTTIQANGPLSFCAGGSVTLDAGAGFTTYAWSGGGSGQTKVVTASGSYTCSITQGACNGTSNTVTVTVSGSSLSPVITASNGLNICGGNTILDAGSGYASYAWSNSGNGQATTVSTAATYTVTVSQGSCTGTAAATVNVGSFPVTVSLSPSTPQSGCQGDVVHLDAGAGHSAYLWSTTAATQAVDVTSSGTVSVTVTDNNACTGSASNSVTINALPVPTPTPAGNQSVCSGGSLTLDAGAGYTTYAWSNGDNTRTTAVSSAGSYTVTVTQNGCSGSSSSPIVVTVNPAPSPTITPAGTHNICSGESVTFDAGSGFSAYLWSTGATTQTISATSTGTYNVTVTQNGCNGSSGNPPTVFANVTPNAVVTQLGAANGFALLQASPANATYQWFLQTQQGGSATLEPNTTSVDTAACGDVAEYHSVIVTQNGCVDTSTAFAVICAGINNISSLMSFSVQPNPASDVLNVTYELNDQTLTQISILDLTGRKALDVLNEVQSKGQHQHNIRLGNLTAGIYMLNFTTDKGQFNTKFVKQ